MLPHSEPRRPARAVVALLGAAALAALTACGSDASQQRAEGPPSAQYPAYVVSSPLTTTNAASQAGMATNAELITGRVYPAVYVPGPAGQMIPNTDLVSTQVLPGPQRQVVYTLAEDAAFSDGDAVTCDDFLLTFTAAKMPELFDAHLPLFDQVDSVDCAPGATRFSLKFVAGQGARWRHLFGPGEVLPSHAIARRAGLTPEELHAALISRDAAALAPVAETWNTGFLLADFDPQLQVSSGPYRIESVGEQGEVVLVRNEAYFGDAANLERITVWPMGTDLDALSEQARIVAADTSLIGEDWFDRDDPDNPYLVTREAGRLTDSLVLAQGGVLATPEARRTFAACVDRDAVARASSAAAGIEVASTAAHVVSAIDPRRSLLDETLAPHLAPATPPATGLEGTVVRVGYLGPSERKAAMVAALAESCALAGIEVVDASAETTAGTAGTGGGMPVDAVLKAVDAESEYGAVGWEASPSELRAAEAALWEDPVVIPLAAQPRSFAIDRELGNVRVYSGLTGVGWNMDRWLL